MSRITLTLSDQERTALFALAEREFRGPREQAMFILHRELEKHGLLTAPDRPAPVACLSVEATPTYNAE